MSKRMQDIQNIINNRPNNVFIWFVTLFGSLFYARPNPIIFEDFRFSIFLFIHLKKCINIIVSMQFNRTKRGETMFGKR